MSLSRAVGDKHDMHTNVLLFQLLVEIVLKKSERFHR